MFPNANNLSHTSGAQCRASLSGSLIRLMLAAMIACTLCLGIQMASADGESHAAYAATTHPIKNLKATSGGYRAVKLSWSKPKGYSGKYTVYRVVSGKLKRIITTSKTSYTVRGLTPGKKYYFKVKSDKLSTKVSKTVITQKTASTTLVTQNGVRWDVRKAAGEVSYGYDTIQGACCNGGYAYMSLYNRDVEKVKIAKVDLETLEVVQLSEPLPATCHANTLTYFPGTNSIVAVCGKDAKKTLAYVDADSLEQTGTFKVSINNSLIDESYVGVAGLAYSEKINRYMLKIRSYSNKIVRCGTDFDYQARVKITKNQSYLLPQGLYARGDYMYDLQSFTDGHSYNMITIRTLGGTFVGKMKLSVGSDSKQKYELENMFYDEVGDQWYVMCYRANVKSSGDTDRKNYLFKLNNLW